MKLNTELAVVELTVTPFWRVNQPPPSVPAPVHTVPAHPPVRNCTLFVLCFTQTVVLFEIATWRPRLMMVASSRAPPWRVAARQQLTNAGALTAVMLAITPPTPSSSTTLNPRLPTLLPPA